MKDSLYDQTIHNYNNFLLYKKEIDYINHINESLINEEIKLSNLLGGLAILAGVVGGSITKAKAQGEFASKNIDSKEILSTLNNKNKFDNAISGLKEKGLENAANILKSNRKDVIDQVNTISTATKKSKGSSNVSSDSDGPIKDSIKASVLLCSASKTPTFFSQTGGYEYLHSKFGLPDVEKGRPVRGYYCTVSELKSQIGKDTSQILSIMKPLNQNVSNNYLKIGDKSIDESGTDIFDISDPNAKIYASGNGLFILTRAIREMKVGKNYLSLQATLSGERMSKSYDLEVVNFDQTAFVNTLYERFEIILLKNKSKLSEDSRALRLFGKFTKMNTTQQIEDICSFIDKHTLKGLPNDSLATEGFIKFDGKDIKQVIASVNNGESLDNAFSTFINKVKENYYMNYKNFTDKYFTTHSDKIVSNIKNKMNWKLGLIDDMGRRVKVTDSIKPVKTLDTKEPSLKSASKNYAEGN